MIKRARVQQRALTNIENVFGIHASLPGNNGQEANLFFHLLASSVVATLRRLSNEADIHVPLVELFPRVGFLDQDAGFSLQENLDRITCSRICNVVERYAMRPPPISMVPAEVVAGGPAAPEEP